MCSSRCGHKHHRGDQGQNHTRSTLVKCEPQYLHIPHVSRLEGQKARDGNKKKKNTAAPEQLKIGDNVLVRDHTSKAFQPKYKDFCIVGLLGKNQIEIKDNHGHTTTGM